MQTILRPALVLFAALTVICCVLYPYTITGVSQVAFSENSNGSIIFRDGKPVGSRLIGQAFTSPQYFWSRPSATAPMPNNAAASGGSNLGSTNPALIDVVKGRIQALKSADPANALPVPVDLVTASASGLDPDISLAAAYYQAGRIARERKMEIDDVRKLIASQSRERLLGLFGEPRVNVLALNMALDERHPVH